MQEKEVVNHPSGPGKSFPSRWQHQVGQNPKRRGVEDAAGSEMTTVNIDSHEDLSREPVSSTPHCNTATTVRKNLNFTDTI
jgi:hypothetical protein